MRELKDCRDEMKAIELIHRDEMKAIELIHRDCIIHIESARSSTGTRQNPTGFYLL